LIPLRPAPITAALRDAEAGVGKTYRVRGVPIEWHKDQLQSFLADHHGSHDAVIRSLALEAHGRSKTGTVTFRDVTQLPKTLRGCLQPDVETQTLTLDDGFLGLTTLFAPPPEDHQIE
jgi:hypothetical protein